MSKDSLFKDQRLYAVFGITLIAVMGVASMTPALPMIAESLQLKETQVGLLISAFTLPGVFLTPFAGVVADRMGRKSVLIPALFLFAAAGFAIFFVRDFKIILGLRVLQGAGAAPLGSLNTTLIGDFFKGKKLPQAMGYNAGVLSLATASYPIIGGFLAGIAWYYPFLMPLIAVPVGLYVIFAVSEPAIENPTSLKEYLRSVGMNIFQKEVIGVFIIGILTFTILYGNFLTYIPFILKHRFNLTAPQIGMFLSISSLATGFIAAKSGKLNNRFGSLNLIKVAFILFFAVNIMIPFTHNIYLFVIPITLFGAAMALNMPSLQTALTKLAPDDERGAFMSINGWVIRLGQTIGPLVIGIGYTLYGYLGAYFLGAFVAIIALIVLFTMIQKDKI
jgi:ACDE family multidrug resistance protein